MSFCLKHDYAQRGPCWWCKVESEVAMSIQDGNDEAYAKARAHVATQAGKTTEQRLADLEYAMSLTQQLAEKMAPLMVSLNGLVEEIATISEDETAP